MKHTAKLIAIATLALVAFSSQAQQLKVATGSKGNTYSTMFGQLSKQCGNEIALVEVATTGSNQNLDMLVGNQVNAVLTQTDVLFFRARTEDLGDVKTLIAMHPEEVHVIALSKVRKSGGTMGFGGKEFTLKTVEQLAGMRVGAVGGSFTTAQVIRLQSEIAFTVVQHAGTGPMLEALNKGELDAVVMVGGAPMDSVATLGAAYTILSFSEATQKKLEGVYRKARVSYSGLNAAGVQTVSTDALFVTREYKTPKMTDALSKFRTCALNSIEELKETTGMHPKWRQVNADNKGKWAYYELPKSKK
jgi:TRAP-type uncharacterized transport system substrate-binding protein